MRTLLIAAAFLPAAAGAQGSSQGFGADVDETAMGGLEEAAALYRAAPPTERAESVVDDAALADAGTVQLAIALGQVEEGVRACRTLRQEMQALIGEDYGSYAVNPGWLRRYQSCILTRADEAQRIGDAIDVRQRELIGRVGAAGDEASSDDAMRAADLMARLGARQSAVKLAVAQEGRLQRAFVRYYNTGQMPEVLRAVPARAEAPTPRAPLAPRVPASDTPGAAAPFAPATPAPQEAPPSVHDARYGEPSEPLPPAVPDDAFPTPDFAPPRGADGAPVPLHNPATLPMPQEGPREDEPRDEGAL